MKNLHGLVTGTTGSGKSTFVRELLRDLPRWIAIDPQGDYQDTADRHTDHLPQLAEWLIAHRSASRFRVSFGASEDHEAAAALSMLWAAYELEPSRPPPLLVVVDEAHLWTDPRRMMPELGRLVRAGRKWGLALLSITPRDVDIHRDLRVLAAVKVAFRQDGGFSDDFAKSWFAGRLEEVTQLAPLDWPRERSPSAGRHYLTSPRDLDIPRFYRDGLAARAPRPSSSSGAKLDV